MHRDSGRKIIESFNQKDMKFLSLDIYYLCRSSGGLENEGWWAWETRSGAEAENLAGCRVFLLEAWFLFLLEVIDGQ